MLGIRFTKTGKLCYADMQNFLLKTGDLIIAETDKGLEIAQSIYERHALITKWLTYIGVDPEVAAEDACKVEHVISAESFEAIKKHIK